MTTASISCLSPQYYNIKMRQEVATGDKKISLKSHLPFWTKNKIGRYWKQVNYNFPLQKIGIGNWAILLGHVHHWHNILSCTAKTSKHLIKKNIGQFIWILCPSFAKLNIFDKLNRFVRYRHIKMRQWWNAEFHHFCT